MEEELAMPRVLERRKADSEAAVASGEAIFSGLRIVPRRTIFGEWEGPGEVCWKCFGLLGLELRAIAAICAL